MQIRRHDLFTTPLWIFDFNTSDPILHHRVYDDRQVREQRLAKLFLDNENNPDFDRKAHVFSFLEEDGSGISRLKAVVTAAVHAVGKDQAWPMDRLSIKVSGRSQVLMPGQSDSPHNHASSLVGVYYVDVPENSGDILLQDTRGFVNFLWQDKYITPENQKSTRVSHRITPKPNTLILFPHYVVHSVETNKSDRLRISVALNITIEDPTYVQY
jgi:uncharacterized protein (TIGR02466 family)